MNASLYATTATNAYNGTHITYLFVLLAIANGTVTNANMSLTANGTLLNSSIQNMTANQTFTMTASWMAARPTTDGNFTLTAKASDGTSEATTSYLLILPIDPPSAIALKGGSKSVNLTTTTGQPERFYLGDLPVSCKAPVNQTGSVGIYNVTNNGTATVNVVFSTNATFFGFDYTISNASTCASGKNMTTSNQTLYSGLAVNASQLFWAWANANTSLSIPPKFKISAGGT